MIARIKRNNSIYTSFVFAVSFGGWKSKVLTFDESFTKLVSVNYWGKKGQNVLFLDYNADEYKINEKNFKCYWNTKHPFWKIKQKSFFNSIIDNANKLQKEVKTSVWYSIKSKADLEALEVASGAFHDGYLMDTYEQGGSTFFVFNTNWGAIITMKTTDIIQNSMRENVEFYDSDLNLANDRIVIQFYSMVDGSDDCLLECKNIEWRGYFLERTPINTSVQYKNNLLMENERIIFDFSNDAFQPIKNKENEFSGICEYYDERKSLYLFSKFSCLEIIDDCYFKVTTTLQHELFNKLIDTMEKDGKIFKLKELN